MSMMDIVNELEDVNPRRFYIYQKTLGATVEQIAGPFGSEYVAHMYADQNYIILGDDCFISN